MQDQTNNKHQIKTEIKGWEIENLKTRSNEREHVGW